MSLNAERVREHLDEFALQPLFIEELGWDRYGGQLQIHLDDAAYVLEGIAEKRGMVALHAHSEEGSLPDYATRRLIERQAARSILEHLIIYTDAGQQTQVWQWVRRELGKPIACREQTFRVGQTGEALIQRLDGLAFSLDEEPSVTLVDVTRRVRAAFDVERITRRFYDRFKAEHDSFLGFITGIETEDDLQWYASVMLIRLVFVYFIEKKGFLDDDREYLRNRLRRLQRERGSDQFLSFYRHFLLRLFHEGLGQRARSSELDELIGDVPYLNGGVFDVHELEAANPDIEIPDEAFERLFGFFDSYQWHLDDRPLRADNEVNPDVLGYIFEKYVNQKQMGAYYTKEDITGYITGSVVLPRLFAKWGEASAAAGTGLPWNLVAVDPGRYIPAALAYGHDEPLPGAIAAGADDFAKRGAWNEVAAVGAGLATETWREVVSRRERFDTLRERLAAGEIGSAANVVTHNLDARQLAQDFIENCESAQQLLGIFRATEELTVLDPTCGSGAFLFAVLNILEPLYEAILERMAVFVAEQDGEGGVLDEFGRVLSRVESHPSRRFFIMKTIVLNNLFGVDIMEEAVEICKLRLFLRLVSQIDRSEDLEPLPDIDFNIRAGNTLVGEATATDVRTSFEERLDGQRKFLFTDASDALERFEKQAISVDEAFRSYRATQTEAYVDERAVAHAKRSLHEQLDVLGQQLDYNLATQYGVDVEDGAAYGLWVRTHQPFNWFAEFHPSMSRGGFDVIVGNPPYVEYSQVAGTYTVRDAEMVALGNLHAMVVARCTKLLSGDGALAMVVPVALPSTNRFRGLRDELMEGSTVWLSHYDFRPSKLFEGAEQRLTIFIRHRAVQATLFSTRFNRWYAEERPYLFSLLAYTRWEGETLRPIWPKVAGDLGRSVLGKIARQPKDVASLAANRGSDALFYKNTGMLYFTVFTRHAPECFINGIRTPSSRETPLRVRDPSTLKPLHALLNSSLFYVAYQMNSNCRDLNPSDIYSFRFPEAVLRDEVLSDLSDRLDANHQANSEMRVRRQKQTGEVRLQTFKPARSKPIIDEIDRALAAHYGFTDEELDFIVSYDLRYRIGTDQAA